MSRKTLTILLCGGLVAIVVTCSLIAWDSSQRKQLEWLREEGRMEEEAMRPRPELSSGTSEDPADKAGSEDPAEKKKEDTEKAAEKKKAKADKAPDPGEESKKAAEDTEASGKETESTVPEETEAPGDQGTETQEGSETPGGTETQETEAAPGSEEPAENGGEPADTGAPAEQPQPEPQPEQQEQQEEAPSAPEETAAPDPAAAAPFDFYSAEAGTVVPAGAVDLSDPRQYFITTEITPGDAVYQRINGYSYRDNPDIALSQLRYMKMLHYNYNGELQVGEMIANVSAAGDLIEIFFELLQQRYQICQMRLVEAFWTGDALSTDDACCANDNTSCFNYRQAADAPNLSMHALGLAVDLNTRENPFVVFGADGSRTVTPPGTDNFADDRSQPHAITHEDAAYRAFTSRGYSWGGDWQSPIDYQHFVRNW